ncbi:hypothetical protein DNL40_15010 [Xylanimonas oleitrophica]|uniref:OmpA-like domain-containing protein n=1 Tax=Xylanimonas oleitrophica TaxID=2607479 RepID=A0A2W5WKJ2_9MICO|nr:OmpA family protein [Xylanimonas oleitrophica]PZR51777.1 hypothetical protein DNL40_15010 [Xylanimonas oleitrophica]
MRVLSDPLTGAAATRRTSRRAAGPLAAALAVVLLGGCTGAPASGEDGSGTTAQAAVRSAPGDVVASVPLTVGGTEVTVDVHPLVRAGEHVVLTYDLVPDGEEDVRLGGRFGSELRGEYVRLADLRTKHVHVQARSQEGEVVGSPQELYRLPAPGVRVQRAFAAPAEGTGTMGVMLPGAYLEAVPVVDGEVPAPVLATGDDGAPAAGGRVRPIDLEAVAEAPVHGLESFTRELSGAVDVLESSEHVRINLGGDVLFDSGSSSLGAEALAVVEAAAARLSTRAPGVVEVVGHTDDVGAAATNQVLSERRAQAVADALAGLIDTDRYELRPSGRGEAQPLVPNTTEENRAANRRVVLTLTSGAASGSQVGSAGELPEFEGPVATGTLGVEIDGVRRWRCTAPAVERVGDSLLVTLDVTALDDAVDSAIAPGALSGIRSYRGEGTSVPRHVLGLTLMAGSSAVHPYDYLAGTGPEGEEVWHTLGELDTLQRVDGGQTLRFVAVYPSVGDVETVTLQLDDVLGAKPFRLTDVPVVG